MCLALKKFEEKQKNFIKEWKIKKEKGFIRYLMIGIVKIIIILLLTDFLSSWFRKEIAFNKESLMAIVFVSIIMPVLSWAINESRYKKCLREGVES